MSSAIEKRLHSGSQEAKFNYIVEIMLQLIPVELLCSQFTAKRMTLCLIVTQLWLQQTVASHSAISLIKVTGTAYLLCP